MTQEIELGLDTFGDIQAGPDGQPLSHAQVIRNVVDEGVLADQSGVFCIGLGEHHRPDFAISSPEALLAAIGARTKHIRLASSVTVLSSDAALTVENRSNTRTGSRIKRACRGNPRPRLFHRVFSVIRVRPF